MSRFCAGVVLCVGLVAAAAVQAESPSDTPRGTVSVLVENDTFTGTDRNYTNGLEFSYFSAPLTRNQNVRFGVSLGQQIFTPEDTDATQPLPGQRPYAGWLYAGLALVVDHGDQLDSFQLNVGVIGPDAQGETVQNNFHRLIGSSRSNGWDNQLRNEFGGQLIYDHRWRGLAQTSGGGIGADVTPHVGFSVGNVATYANAGVTLRVGKDLRNDYGAPRIRPSLPGSGYFDPINSFAWYLFAGVDGRAVARNIFLDGNSNVPSLSVERKDYVADLQAGLALTFSRFRVAYTYVYRSKEFEGQPAADRFGSIGISARF